MDITIQEVQPRRRLEFEQEENPTNFSTDDQMMESLHSKIPKDIVPRVGMEFATEDATYEFYNAYALATGFSVRRGWSHRYNNTVIDRVFVCSCQGKRESDKRDAFYKSHRPETRFGCLAKLKISCRQTGKYRVVDFVAKHEHNLASPSKAHLFRSHRKVSNSQALEVDLADISGIAPKNAYEFMARQAGGRENLGFAQVDYRNYLRTKRSLQMKSGDTGGVLEYLQSMKIEDPCFFYGLQVDEDDMITNIFWADAKMMADYDDFGDVICFDTTYRKHKDGRPIALFVGVNHHKQTTIFGVALLYDETANSFIWLFDTFSKAMGGKLPKTILTDQDAAMRKALASQWPGVFHRLCIWHIFQNAAIHLSHVFIDCKDFLRDFSKCIYDYEYEEDFLDAWSKMLEKYGLQSNEWLERMFNMKEKWALVYGRDTFCADMTTTQRSESMNKMIKHYVSYKHDLRSFFQHFQKLLIDRRYDEMMADFKASQSQVSMFYPVEILKHAASIYTPKVFKWFQEEFGKSCDCHLQVCDETGTLVKYMVTPYKKNHSFVVCYDETEETVFCNCRKFEFAGMLCSHILKVFSFKGTKRVPSKYFLKRWTRDAKKRSMTVSIESLLIDENPKLAMGRRYRELSRLSTRLVTRAAEVEDGYNLVKEGLIQLMSKLDLSSTGRLTQPSLQNSHMSKSDPRPDINENPNDMMKVVKGIKSKPKSGSQSSKRPRGGLETGRSKNRKPKQNVATEDNLVSPMDNRIEEHTNFAHHPQGNQIVHPLTYNFAPSMYKQSGTYIFPVPTQPQFQPSHMALLTSIGVPQVQPDDGLES